MLVFETTYEAGRERNQSTDYNNEQGQSVVVIAIHEADRAHLDQDMSEAIESKRSQQ